ncbi:hypothetical protein [Pararhizobium gei]|uniref:hypothetical protein n=1 Tax=Pararhizobium gei TaxID=1395951 RepID=UPI0023DB6F76|nr:hypothetical protein [Rhizobium gei]
MARMTISIPDELKNRMDALEGVNWSAVAKRAYEIEVEVKAQTKGDDMSGMVERMRAGKVRKEMQERPEWVATGRRWAVEDAEYEQLSAIAKIDLDGLEHDPRAADDNDARHFLGSIAFALYGECDDFEINEAFLLITGDDFDSRKASTRTLVWWVEGAQQAWNEVKEKI